MTPQQRSDIRLLIQLRKGEPGYDVALVLMEELDILRSRQVQAIGALRKISMGVKNPERSAGDTLLAINTPPHGWQDVGGWG